MIVDEPMTPNDSASDEQPTDAIVVCQDEYWSEHPIELEEALRTLNKGTRGNARRQDIKDAVHQLLGAVGTIVGEIVLAPFPASMRRLPQPERLTLSVEEAAEARGISRALAYEAVQRGEIPSIRIGKRILIPKARLNDLLAPPEEPAS
jgi:excisionase family DNA binding protein